MKNCIHFNLKKQKPLLKTLDFYQITHCWLKLTNFTVEIIFNIFPYTIYMCACVRIIFKYSLYVVIIFPKRYFVVNSKYISLRRTMKFRVIYYNMMLYHPPRTVLAFKLSLIWIFISPRVTQNISL